VSLSLRSLARSYHNARGARTLRFCPTTAGQRRHAIQNHHRGRKDLRALRVPSW
jgi:hypothetical protein